MFRELQEAVNRKPVANGLAIIVANEDSVKPDHNHLPGARRDLDTMKWTFEKLKFATFPLLNPSRDQLVQVIEAAVSIQMQYPKSPDPQAYGRLVFYFSGHGDGSYIYTHDEAVHLQNEVFPPFLPENSPHLAKIPKFFFIDTCRGAGTDEGVKISVCPPQQFRARGGGGEEERMTSIGNYLLACSTSPSKKAFENSDGGFWTQELARQLYNPNNIDLSVHDVLGKVNKSLIDEMSRLGLKSLQQPVLESTLIGEPVRLLKEAVDIVSHPERECYFTEQQHVILGSSGVCEIQNDPESESQLQEIITQFQSATPVSLQMAQLHCYDASNHDYMWPQSVPPQQMTIQGGGMDITGTEQPFFNDFSAPQGPQLANGTDPSSALQYDLTLYQGPLLASGSGNPTSLQTAGIPVNPHHHGDVQTHYAPQSMTTPFSQSSSYQRHSSDPHAYGTMQNVIGEATGYQKQYSEPTTQRHIPSQLNLKDGNEQGRYRGLLNHFSQTGEISDYHDQGCRDSYSDGRTLYQSFLFMKHVATRKQISATSQWMSSKSEAKEDAARDAYKQIDALVNGQQGRGGSESSRDSNTSRAIGPGIVTTPRTPQTSTSQSATKRESPTAKVWKQRLKEYFDKKLKGKGVAKISYETPKENQNGRFSSIVYCPEIGMAEGDKDCPSKKAAEHSAAYNALKKLNALPK